MQKKKPVSKGAKNSVGRVVFGQKEKKRLIQLAFCVVLFLIVFFGKGSHAIGSPETNEAILHVLQNDTDFVGAFSAFGETVAENGSLWDGLTVFVRELLGITNPSPDDSSGNVVLVDGPAVKLAQSALRGNSNSQMMILSPEKKQETMPEANGQGEETAEETQVFVQQDTEQEPVAAEIPEYTGPALPAGATMDYYDLELEQTVTPVLGHISSNYGYRDHPISGEYSFHAGVDIASEKGTPIAAFADATVEFIGESAFYGLYVQLDHGNGIKTFYCHCSELLYGTGKTVRAGQTIAKVGDTGNTTGPHLHFELKREGVLLNPLYYIETVS